MVLRIIRFLTGLLLLPVCWIVTLAVVELIKMVQPSSTAAIPQSAGALGGGFAFWIALFVLLPRPVRTYVLAHELTHALWAVMRGARVKNIRISREQGSVTVSKTDFLITLAPYFFPLYTVIVIAAYYFMSIFMDMQPYELYWLGMVGLTWGFHFSFTIVTLLQYQSDIRECGRLFSYTVIYLFNIIGIALWIVFVSSVTIENMVLMLYSSGNSVLGQIYQILCNK